MLSQVSRKIKARKIQVPLYLIRKMKIRKLLHSKSVRALVIYMQIEEKGCVTQA